VGKYISGLVVALMLVVALVLGLFFVARPADAAPMVVSTISVAVVDRTPVDSRVIEVVDKVGPASWRVGTAVDWVDRYTTSDMRMVGRCSGRAYRCITVKTGKVNGDLVGWSQGSTITIDVKKANSKRYRVYYRWDKNRTWLLTHELGHQFGLSDSPGRDVMNRYVNRYRMVLTAGQRVHLCNR